jgi:lipopolysaccharide export LptBFGC system permease protein LptF
MSVFEIIMLVCFGAAWPVSIRRSYRSRTNAGKSLGFLMIIFLGYVSGIMHKVVFNPDPVIFLYAFNALLVAVDIVLYARNRKLAPDVAAT